MHFDWWTLALQTVNFAVLVWLLHRFLYKPVLRMIDARKADVQKQYDEAKATEDKAKASFAAIQAERAGIAAEREAALKAAAAQAQEAAQARLDAARKTLAREREHALAELRQSALDLGAEFAGRLLAEIPAPLRAEAWMERIEQHLEALPKMERDALVGPSPDGRTLTIVTPSSLPTETAETWRNRLRRSLGETTAIAFEADPALVAGAELHFPTAILRFSWRSALDALRSEIDVHGNAR
jgi:F-type H+-transporting ATPase subunit b